MNTNKSNELFENCKKYIPGGVNSPVRAFKSVGGNPIFMAKAKGAYLTDVDGNQYIDFINSWGPAILGHAPDFLVQAVQNAVNEGFGFGTPTEKEFQMANLIHEILPHIEKIRMVNSGTEATMSAIRVARGYTGKSKFIKFEGCYHGHGDSFLIAAGSGAMTFGVPDSKGVTDGTAKDTLLAPYNDLDFVKKLISENKDQIAALILEPVVGNMGLVPPNEGFLVGLRQLCTENNIVLIFDEVMTGFRLSLGGAQELFNITPDLSTFGKIIGGGMPVGAYGGKAEIMDCVSPQGPVYQAGTLSGNPIAMTAGLAVLNHLKNDKSFYENLNKISEKLCNEIAKVLNSKGITHQIQRVGSMFTIFFNDKPISNWNDAKTSNTELYGKFFHHLLDHGIYGAPSQYEAWFVCSEIGENEINKFIEVLKKWEI